MNKSYFSAWTSIDLSKDDTAKADEKLGFIKGVVSSELEDQAGDIIKQDGLDWTYFLDKGYFNWEHKDGPENILGYPTKILKGESDTSVEGYLFLDRPKAKDAYDMAKILKDVQAPRSIGFSIEGQVIERDKENENIITKAKILNVSVTAHPCNPDAKMMVKALADMEDYMKKKTTVQPTLLKTIEEDEAKKKAEAEAAMAQTEDEKKAYSSDDDATKSTTEDTAKNDDSSTKEDDQGSKADDQEAQKVAEDDAEKGMVSKSEDDDDDINKAEDDDEDDEDDSLDDDSLDDSSLTDDFWDDADRKYVDEAFSALWTMLGSLQDQLTAQIKTKRVAQRQALAQKSIKDASPVSSKDLLERIAKHFPTMTLDQQKQLTRKSADIIREYFVKD